MASFSDEAMDNYMYSAYNPYSYRYNPKTKGMSWRQKNYYSNYSDTGEYFDNYQRAQLKAILSQVNPNLTPRLRKANTRDVGIQVNPRQDVSIQCSLGPRTLLRRRVGNLKKPQQVPTEEESPTTPPIKTVRFPRTLAVYSPVSVRRPAALQDENEDALKATEKTLKDGVPPSDKEGDKDGETKEATIAGEEMTQPIASPGQTRLRFQASSSFLEQKYGFYHCKDCNIRWESAYVWCVHGTNKVYFKQFCRTCQKSFNPYRVEDIMCQSCKQTRCICPVKVRHVDPKRPHRQDLCGRCKGKRLSCDSTYSFKYII
ncbi:multicellular organism development [Pristimantis euphronides]